MDFFNIRDVRTQMLFWFLERCQGVKQSPDYHPEGDVFNHSIQVGSMAFKETNDIDLIISSYLHDVGKIILSQKHSKIGCILLTPYVSVKTIFLIENHMRIWSYINGEMKKQSKCQSLVGHPWLSELIQLARWDKMGRNPNRKIIYNRDRIIDGLNKCTSEHFYLPDYLKNTEENES